MKATILGLKICDTCRKARKALPEAAFRDIREIPLTEQEIDALLSQFGDRLINRASTTWRGLEDGARGAPPADLIAAHPALMKRPVIQTESGDLLGWTTQTRAALGLE